MKKYWFYGILIFIFSVIIGYSYSRIWNDHNSNNVQNLVYESDYKINGNIEQNEIIETVSEEEKVLPTTSFAIKKIFSQCGHFNFSYTELPLEIINLKKEEVERVYNDWKVEEFSEKEIIISKEFDELCDEHFIIKLDNGFVKIYNKIDENNIKLYKETEIAKEYLTQDDIQKLEIGILVYGRGQLNSIIEDFE